MYRLEDRQKSQSRKEEWYRPTILCEEKAEDRGGSIDFYCDNESPVKSPLDEPGQHILAFAETGEEPLGEEQKEKPCVSIDFYLWNICLIFCVFYTPGSLTLIQADVLDEVGWTVFITATTR